MIAGGSTTITVTIVQPATAAENPVAPKGTNDSARSATRSPSAYVSATAAASIRQDEANPRSEAGRSLATSEYNSPPMPMPASATASTRPKVNTDPPSSGPSSRYQTSSIRKNAKPTVAAATRRKRRPGRTGRAAGGWGGSGRTGMAGWAGQAGWVGA